MVYIGIDLGGTNIKAGIVDEQGKILWQGGCPSKVERGHEAVIADMAALARKAVEKAGLTMDDVKCIGIGVPGILDPKTGVVPFCVNLGWHNVPLRELMRSHIDKPVFHRQRRHGGRSGRIRGRHQQGQPEQRIFDLGHRSRRRHRHQRQGLQRRPWSGL